MVENASSRGLIVVAIIISIGVALDLLAFIFERAGDLGTSDVRNIILFSLFLVMGAMALTRWD